LIKENNGGKDEPVQIGVNNSRDESIRDRAKKGVLMFFTILPMKNGRIFCRFPLTKKCKNWKKKLCEILKEMDIFRDKKI
jgi:hypothetical protein